MLHDNYYKRKHIKKCKTFYCHITSLYQKETIVIYCTFLYKFYKKVLTTHRCSFFIIRYHTYFYCKNKNNDNIISVCNSKNTKEKSYTDDYLTFDI
jgi:hypothetical protein